jgi:hypothetical protein
MYDLSIFFVALKQLKTTVMSVGMYRTPEAGREPLALLGSKNIIY